MKYLKFFSKLPWCICRRRLKLFKQCLFSERGKLYLKILAPNRDLKKVLSISILACKTADLEA